MKSCFLNSPNVPKSRVTTVVVSSEDKRVAEALELLEVEAVFSDKSANLPEQTCFHPDVQVLHLGGNSFAVDDSCDTLFKKLKAIGANIAYYEKTGQEYPNDCVLNALLVGGTAFCLKQISANWKETHFDRIEFVNQGYSRCAAAVVTEKAIITADLGIAAKARKKGIDCLVIPHGEISLNGYDYGFIGGCCGLVGQGRLAFAGDPISASFGQDIYGFCKKHGVKILPLFNGQLTDIGGILPIKEICD